MRSCRRLLELALLVPLLALAGAARGQTLGAGVEDVRACIERNAPASGRQRVQLQRTDRAGNERRLEATVWWKRDEADHTRFVARVESPTSERGASFLFVESDDGGDLWTYLPDVRTVRRVTGRAVSGSFFASDFTYEDIARLQGEATHARIERLPDAEVEGRPAYVLEGVGTRDADAPYDRVVTFVDRETCVVLRADLHGPSGEVAKQLRVAWPDVERQGRYWRARRISMRDLTKGSESLLVFTESEWDAEIPDRRFHPNELARAW